MTKIPLTGGSYEAASIMASCQRCVNLYPENMTDSQGELSHTTYYPTPGLTLLATSPTDSPARCVYRASNGELFVVNDKNIYFVSSTWTFTLVGSFAANSGNPVVMSDNGTNVIAVDGTPGVGLTFLLSGHGHFSQITDAGWLGSTYIDFMDTFFIANFIDTPTFYISGSEAITFAGGDFAGKSGKPDFLIAAIAVHGVIWLIGTTETEVWYGGIVGLGTTISGVALNTFPFTPMDGVRIDDGCGARYSVAKTDTMVFWLAQNLNGGNYVLLGSGYKTTRISTPAMEAVFASYSTTADAIGYCYMQRGHHFYVLNFPTADATWVFDTMTQKWHERVWLDPDGLEHRHRALFHGYAYGTNVTGDWQNGNLYKYDLTSYTDNGLPVKRLRSFPALIDEGQNYNRVIYKQFQADIEVGRDANPNEDPFLSLRWSDTRGANWSNPIRQSFGQSGDYLTNISWSRLGMARARVFELSWSCNIKTALNGCFIQTADAAS